MRNAFTLQQTPTSKHPAPGIACMPALNALVKNSAESLAKLDCDNMPKLFQFLRYMQESDSTYAPFVANNIADFISWYTSKALSPFQPEFLSSEILADQLLHLSMFNDGLFRFIGCFNEEETKEMDIIATYMDDVIGIYAECYAATAQMETALPAKSKTA